MPTDRHSECARLLRAGVPAREAMVRAGWSEADAAGMVPHIAEFLRKNGHDVTPVTTAPQVAPAEPAGQPVPVVTVADIAVAQPKTDVPKPARPRGRPPKGKTTR